MKRKNNNGNISEIVYKLAEPIANDLGLSIWDVKFIKEGSGYYLRIFIDREKGITIDDCEKMSRAIDGPLDKLDPIKQNYCLEVCSPGIERELTKNEHFKRFIGHKIIIRLIRPLPNGIRQLKGKLFSFNDNEIKLSETDGNIISILKKDTAFIKLDDFEN